MITVKGYIVADEKDFTARSNLVDVVLQIRVRMTQAEAKAYGALVDEGLGTIDASVTIWDRRV